MPGFFKKFPTVQYSVDGYSKDAMNILSAAILKRVNVDRSFVYQDYDVPSGVTPEALAYELYKDASLCWVFFLVNRMVNPLRDWPMSSELLEDFVVAEYGDPNAVLYHIDSDGVQNDSGIGRGVTAFEHENRLNLERNKITVIAPRYINQFVDLFNKAVA